MIVFHDYIVVTNLNITDEQLKVIFGQKSDEYRTEALR